MRIRSALVPTAVISAVAALTIPATPATARTTSHSAASGPVVVVSGLNNPRQLSFSTDGRTLYIAEAGRGGPNCVSGGPGGGEVCIGFTASVSTVDTPWAVANSAPHRLVQGMLSGGGKDGSFSVGLDGVSARDGKVFGIETWAPPDILPHAPASRQAGKLFDLTGGHIHAIANITAVEQSDPDGQGFDSDPYAVLALPGAGRQLVADAAGNDIILVDHGATKVWHVFPNHDGHQAVPTSLALARDGSIYVGELNGEHPGTARVYHFSPSGHLLGFIGGFTTITGVAVAPNGTLYVSQLFAGGTAGPPGLLTKVPTSGPRVDMPVPFPSGVVVGGNGTLYVSAWSISPQNGFTAGPGQQAPPGQVWRVHF